ncbi:hypothetical protein TPHA_0B04910 [Tetrapisispora phaffii CBS 4417]|uniref:Uncharacterized protein n=1 Tax=Tetrapisispora phaffii (strain ATCC 24235 / CBS 4417 / NBRC 1672 / NRRL Y-8282 / UCD 70-5) TaxID=1071381 RepID=G8BQ82_TETPH|nr:hypothetical protein TPHA_0B04910 [Tetrapisispora phaffii CBS 4417]CCE62163.1 hypothetical protein TPHA_0B04910 [Tetrapisispora phaffii CBS 4417]
MPEQQEIASLYTIQTTGSPSTDEVPEDYLRTVEEKIYDEQSIKDKTVDIVTNNDYAVLFLHEYYDVKSIPLPSLERSNVRNIYPIKFEQTYFLFNGTTVPRTLKEEPDKLGAVIQLVQMQNCTIVFCKNNNGPVPIVGANFMDLHSLKDQFPYAFLELVVNYDRISVNEFFQDLEKKIENIESQSNSVYSLNLKHFKKLLFLKRDFKKCVNSQTTGNEPILRFLNEQKSTYKKNEGIVNCCCSILQSIEESQLKWDKLLNYFSKVEEQLKWLYQVRFGSFVGIFMGLVVFTSMFISKFFEDIYNHTASTGVKVAFGLLVFFCAICFLNVIALYWHISLLWFLPWRKKITRKKARTKISTALMYLMTLVTMQKLRTHKI